MSFYRIDKAPYKGEINNKIHNAQWIPTASTPDTGDKITKTVKALGRQQMRENKKTNKSSIEGGRQSNSQAAHHKP